MRVPFEVSAKGMKNTDETRSKIFCFIHFCEHVQDYVTNGMKKAVEQSAILEKVGAKFFRDCKNTVSMNTGD